MDSTIKHIWFDFSGTLFVQTNDVLKVHNDYRYKIFSEAVGKPFSSELIAEYEALYKNNGSNSAVFRFLGLPDDYWQKKVLDLDLESVLKPDPDIYETLHTLHTKIPTSIFTNLKLPKIDTLCSVLKIDKNWFKYILSGDDVEIRKPALDGFHLMIEKSQLPAGNILYVGDRVDVDIKPAKAVGMKTALVFSESPEADYSFVNFADILSVIK